VKTIIVKGKVQGVGLQGLSALKPVEKVGTNCTAENLDDGSVRITISGDKAGVFVEELKKKKPSLAIIKKITMK